jgi:hypothetical protein
MADEARKEVKGKRRKGRDEGGRTDARLAVCKTAVDGRAAKGT